MILLARNIIHPSLLWCVALLLVPNVAVAQQPGSSTYCVAGSPTGISWLSASVPDIRTISLAEAGASLSLTPWHGRIFVQLMTTSPYKKASIRIASPGIMSTNSVADTILDCGNQAVGIATEDSGRNFLIGIFEPATRDFMSMVPLRLDITVVQSQEEDGMGRTSIVYAFETIVIEEWMITAPGQAGKAGDVDVIVTGRGGLDMSIEFPYFEPEPKPFLIGWGHDWTTQRASTTTTSQFISIPSPQAPEPEPEPANIWQTPSANDNSDWEKPSWNFVSDTTSTTNYALAASSGIMGGVSMGLLFSLSVAASLLF